MKNKVLFHSLLAAGCFAVNLTTTLHAALLGTAFTYQGRLSAGTNAASGTYDFQFALYDSLSGGAQVGSTVSRPALGVTNGSFTITLDFGNVFPGEARWLGVSVKTNGAANFTALTPRQALTPTPGAIYATTAGSAATAGVASTASTATTATTANAVAPNAIASAGLQNGAVTAAKIASGQVVKSLNSLKDDVSLAAGANLTLTPSGQTLTLASPTDWHLGGNTGTTPGTHFLGTADDQPLCLGVNNRTALRLEPGFNTDNIIAGSSYNSVAADVAGAAIGGGGRYLPSLPPLQPVNERNAVNADYGTIAGGKGNTISSNAVCATIPGGHSNTVSGAYSLAAGQRAKALHNGTFVWADSTNADFASSGSNQFLIRASGGVGIGTTTPRKALDVADGTGTNHAGGNIHIGGYVNNGDPKLIHFGDLRSDGLGYVYLGENGADDTMELRASRFFFNVGRVGIGTNNPQAPLHVVGTVRADAFISGTNTPASFGSVGIGTATPQDALLDLEGDMHLNDHDLFLRGGADRNHGLGWYGSGKSFGGLNVDGPVLFGCAGGGLGTACTGPKLALGWNYEGNVIMDPHGTNVGALTPGLIFGPGSGEGLSSKRTAGPGQHGLDFYTGFNKRMTIANDGNVGIGTAEPGCALQIYHDVPEVRVTSSAAGAGNWGLGTGWTAVGRENFYLYDYTAGATRLAVDSSGLIVHGNLSVNGVAAVNVLQILGGSDIAEPFDVSEGEVRPGYVMCIDADRPGQLRLATRAYDSTVAGIVSGAGGVNPGLTLTQEGSSASGSHPVALSGRVYCWVDAEAGGAVQPGDLLTTSDTPGHAMKVMDRAKAGGATLGKAMTRLESGRGLVLVLVTLQ
ncbi:MAG: hypothetical protein HZA90_17845 [Verrucomicrobia bacterium]|nr:hypothetical protein [Verrucomicrobiota bacterium]